MSANNPDVDLQKALDIKGKYEKEMLAKPGVYGIGAAKMGEVACIVLYVAPSFAGKDDLPKELDGIPVTVRALRNFRPLGSLGTHGG